MGLDRIFNQMVNSFAALEPESVPEPARLTPVPFPRPHMPCRFGPGGLLVTVHANHPLDGQRATLDVSNVQVHSFL